MSAVTSIPRVAKAGFTSFIRNGWLSVAATGIVTFSLVLISIFAMLLLLGGNVVTYVQQKIDIEVFFKDDAKVQDIQTLQQQLETNPNTLSVNYVSKQQALQKFKGQSDESKQLVDDAFNDENNPLPASLEIKAKDTSKLDAFNQTLDSDFAKPLIQQRSDEKNRTIIQNLQRIVGIIKGVGISISLVILVFSVLVVFNTIRITIFSRREEIEIMRLVGASNWYIRGPFIMEGVFYGVIATVISLAVSKLLVVAFGPALTRFLGTDIPINVSRYFDSHLLPIGLLLLVIGVSVGVVSSLIAIRRHLRV